MVRVISIFVVVWCAGCATVIVPPERARAVEMAPVLVADYGYHSTLILPRSDGGLVEYAYGDWLYFGNSHKTVGAALQALVASEQATLGRRLLDRLPQQGGLEEATGAVSVVRFEASRAKVEELERELERRFSARLDSILYSPEHRLYFVKDDVRYGMGHNCNHSTAEWLERLGCRVEGVVMLSKFTVKGEQGGVAAPGVAQTAKGVTTRPAPGKGATTRAVVASG
jgi:hypothetical protein